MKKGVTRAHLLREGGKRTLKKIGGSKKTSKKGGRYDNRPRPLSASEEEFAATCFWDRKGGSTQRSAGSQPKLPASERVRIAGMVATLERQAQMRHGGTREGGIWPFSATEEAPWYSRAASAIGNVGSNLGSAAYSGLQQAAKLYGYYTSSELPWYSRAASWISEAAAPVTAFLTSNAGLYSLGAAGIAALTIYYLRRTASAAAADERKAKSLRDARDKLSAFIPQLQRFAAVPAAASIVQPFIAKTQEFLEAIAPTLNNPFLADDAEPPGADKILATIFALLTEGNAINEKLKATIAAQANIPFPSNTSSTSTWPPSAPSAFAPSPFSSPSFAASPFSSAAAPFPLPSAPPCDPAPWPSPSSPSYSQLPFPSAAANAPWSTSPFSASPFASAYNNNPVPFSMGSWPTSPFPNNFVEDPPAAETFPF